MMPFESELLPRITTMIRLDHSHVLALFRRFKPETSLRRKQALVTNACLALEIHAQLEEETFYPALRVALGADPTLAKSVPEHDEMRRLIGVLRHMTPQSARYDDTFRKLIRTALHHIADEETVLLPQAEIVLRDKLAMLGAQMTKRRLQLLAPHASEVIATTVRSFPVASLIATVGIIGVAVALTRYGARSRRRRFAAPSKNGASLRSNRSEAIPQDANYTPARVRRWNPPPPRALP